MEKIPVPPYRTYLAKYKVMNVAELESAQKQLEIDIKKAVSKWTETQMNGTSDQEYTAYITARNLKAEYETLNSVLDLKRIGGAV